MKLEAQKEAEKMVRRERTAMNKADMETLIKPRCCTYSMRSIYIMNQGKNISVGFVCLYCGEYIIEVPKEVRRGNYKYF